MSLLITSNETIDGGNAPVNVGINRPYDYINNFSQPLEIPPNSKIAVQSVKINKEGGLQVNQANNQFGLYFGDRTANADLTVSLENYTETVKYTRVNEYGNKNQTFTIDEFAKQLETSLNNALFNPALQNSALTGGGTAVTVLRDATTNDFEGYKYEFNQSVSGSLVDNKTDMNFVDICAQPLYVGGGTWNGGAATVTQDDSDKLCEMIATSGPLSNQEGVFTTSFKDAGPDWVIGLTRYQDETVTTLNDQMPGYLTNSGTLPSYYDYAVKSVRNDTDGLFYLRVYHTLVIDGGNGISTQEFEYWNNGVPATVAALTGPIEVYTLSASYTTAKISKVKFMISNEKLVLDLFSDDDTTTVYTLANGAQVTKADNLKPCCATMKYLYPKVYVEDYADFLTIETFNGDPPANFVYGDKRSNIGAYPQRQPNTPNNHDWWCKLYHTDGEFEYGSPVDYRYMNDYYDTTGGPTSDGNYTQHGVNASGGLAGDFVIVVENDEAQGWIPSKQFNGGEMLGFNEFSTVSASTTVNLLQTFYSESIPNMVSTNSLFVRLNNFTQTSFNCMTGSPSKILYHLPRFTNSGQEFGGLFFEPTEKVYVALNNPAPLIINDLSISIVNVNETLADNLTGKTVVCFHLIHD